MLKLCLIKPKAKVLGDGFDQVVSRLANIANAEGGQTDEEILEQAIDLRENGKYGEAINLLLHQTNQSFINPNIQHCCHIVTF